jgi:hypothetical protein
MGSSPKGWGLSNEINNEKLGMAQPGLPCTSTASCDSGSSRGRDEDARTCKEDARCKGVLNCMVANLAKVARNSLACKTQQLLESGGDEMIRLVFK